MVITGNTNNKATINKTHLTWLAGTSYNIFSGILIIVKWSGEISVAIIKVDHVTK